MTKYGTTAALVAAVFLLAAGPSLAATIEVTTLDDEVAVDGDCSLREAMVAANDNVGADDCTKGQGGSKRDVIELADAEYGLDIPGTDEDLGQTGDLDYTGGGKLTIRCAEGTGCGIDATGSGDRAIHALGNAKDLRIERLFVEDGEETSGGLVYVSEGSLKLVRAELRDGSAESLGGGVYYSGDEGLIVKRSLLLSNQAIAGGGAYTLTDGPIRFSRTQFIDNSAVDGAARGGALYASGAVVSDSTFLANETTSDGGGSALGGAIYGSDYKVSRSLFTGNESSEVDEIVGSTGGAIRASGETTVVNSTFFDNSSADTGGAFSGEGKLSHNTFLQNSADEGGDHVGSTSAPIVLRNSILPGAAIAVDVCSGDGVTSKGFNVFSYDDPDCGTLDSDVANGGNAGLDPGGPSDNGGPTHTIAIAGDSIAKDLIPKRKCKVAKGEDQRRFERPKGTRCDAGAYEKGAKP